MATSVAVVTGWPRCGRGARWPRPWPPRPRPVYVSRARKRARLAIARDQLHVYPSQRGERADERDPAQVVHVSAGCSLGHLQQSTGKRCNVKEGGKRCIVQEGGGR